jgi:uncharacterized protein (TIGR00369 family)
VSDEHGDGSALDEPLDDEPRDTLRQAFHEIPLHALLDIDILELGERHCVASMPVGESAFNSTGNLHGGAIATLIDIAAGTAAALGSGIDFESQSLVTADMHTRYLGRPHGETVWARGDVLRAGRQLIVVECRVTDIDDRTIAYADFSSMIVSLRQPLFPEGKGERSHPDL